MKEFTQTYHINELPDIYFPEYQIKCQGDVLGAVSSCSKNILYTMANSPSGAVSLTIRYIFNPEPKDCKSQSRLNIYLIATADNHKQFDDQKKLIKYGMLNELYKIREIEDTISLPWDKFHGVSDIVRRDDRQVPATSPEFNSRIPDHYYLIKPFVQKQNNCFDGLLKIFGNTGEWVIIDFLIQPESVNHFRALHAAYLSSLNEINRTWRHDTDEDIQAFDYIPSDNLEYTRFNKELRPFNHPDPIADDIKQQQQRFHDSLDKLNFKFRLRVMAETTSTSTLIGSAFANEAFNDGSFRLLTFKKGDPYFNNIVSEIRNNEPAAIPFNEVIHGLSNNDPFNNLWPLINYAATEELSEAFKLPVTSGVSYSCIRTNTDPLNKGHFIFIGDDQQIPGMKIGISEISLNKGTCIFGTPGSAKTTCMFNIIRQLNEKGIPFIIFDPVKSEYRKLKNSLVKNLQLYTPGNEQISPLRINPIKVIDGVSEEHHSGSLLEVFNAAMPISGPLPALLGEALEHLYIIFNNKKEIPALADLVTAVEEIMLKKGYPPETLAEIKTALEVRLKNLLRVVSAIFRCTHNVPDMQELLTNPVCIELDELHPDQKCLITLLFFVSIMEHLKVAPKSEKPIRFAIIIDEAHRLIGRASDATPSPDNPNAKGFTTEYFCNMLAEFRALGVAIIIADQLPTAVAPQVIKQTATKICFRMVDKEDREIIGQSMNCNEVEMKDLVTLNPGVAYFFTESFHSARKIVTPNLYEQYDLNTDVSGEKIVTFISQDPWFQNCANSRAALELTILNKNMDNFDVRRLDIFKKFIDISKTRLDGHIPNGKQQARLLKTMLTDEYIIFKENHYNKFLPKEIMGFSYKQEVYVLKDFLVNRFETSIQPGVDKIIQRMDSFINEA